jgi:hypothetical protein
VTVRIGNMPDQVIRLVILFAILTTGLVVLRKHFVPESFGVEGHFRADAVIVEAEKPMQYAGAQVCGDCHEDEWNLKSSSFHRGVACETCHGAAAAHVDAPDETTPVVPTGRSLCLSCHVYNPSRPTGFPQVVADTHNPNKACMECHNPHEPTPPQTPSTCGACHATVARTKAVSHHATLDCETCHTAPPEHRLNPRAYVVKKPADRSLCGRCHAKEADSPRNIPRIDLATHGGNYVCWQCHYPHYPEAR